MNLLYHLRRFRACRIFAPPHCHVNGLCPLVSAEWETLRQSPATFRLWLLLLAGERP